MPAGTPEAHAPQAAAASPSPGGTAPEAGCEDALAPTDAVIVGSGPNGLAAAVTLARAGLQVTVLEAEDTLGGGARTLDLGLVPGLAHDVCSAVHPMALASPFLREFDLAARGVDLRVPEVSYAQALEGRPAAIAWRDLERTVDGLGPDGATWRRLFGPLVAHWPDLVELILSDKRSLPRTARTREGMVLAARLVAAVARHGTALWDRPWKSEAAPALLTGVAAHAIVDLPSPAAAGTVMLLGTLAHAGGWPIPVGGSQAIVDALVTDLHTHGARLVTGHPVHGHADLPPARAVLLDTDAAQAARILGDRIPARTHRALRRYPHGDGAATVDFVLSGPVPWRDGDVGRAGTVHIGGSRAEIAAAEHAVSRGRMPQRPVVLASDPTILDPSRAVGALRPLWTYAHVPAGEPRDPSDAVIAQIERFAPGFRDVIVAAHAVPAARLHEHNRNLVAGDIALGRVSLARMIARPSAAPDPFHLGGGAYLCSAATPPGPGVHGLSGWYAARRALAREFGIHRAPSLRPEL
ncbi:NAD(P)/FAD-dependent oxidoreductase [Brachybacterium sp. EF45031]|nr:NAD(P)/FAD-dependent oxidoreductase [Brachybacterium sillae]